MLRHVLCKAKGKCKPDLVLLPRHDPVAKYQMLLQ